MGQDKASGGCYCGAVRYEFSIPAAGCIHCHCTLCRRLHGCGFTTWLSVLKCNFQIIQGQDRLVLFSVSRHSSKFFCGKCGTSVYYTDERYREVYGLLLGTVADAIELNPRAHAFYDCKAEWIKVADDLPHLGGASGNDKLSE